MDPKDLESDPRFKALRHRFYKLGGKGLQVLQKMGSLQEVSDDIRIPKEEQRNLLFGLAQGRLEDLERAIEEEEGKKRINNMA